MKAIGFLIDNDFDCIDGIVYLPGPLYTKMHDLYQACGRNDTKLMWELESAEYEQIYNSILSYAALCTCMFYAKNGNPDYKWCVELSFDNFNFEPQSILFDADLYLRSLYYSQWRIESYIESRVICHNPKRSEYIRRKTKLHNEHYTQPYWEWIKQSFVEEEYLIEQYKREIDEKIKQHDITLPLLEEYARKFQKLGLTNRGLLVLLRKLDLTYENKKPHRDNRHKSFVSEYGTKREEYKEPPSKSIRAIFIPMGGQNKRR